MRNPSFGPREILQSLICGLGLQPPVDGQPLVLTIQQALLERRPRPRPSGCGVLIDEAQAMPPESLEEIKLLSNLETAQHKLLQIVLFGQPELDELLALPKLRQVRDRVCTVSSCSPSMALMRQPTSNIACVARGVAGGRFV